MDDIVSRKKNSDSENKKMFRSRFDLFVLNALNNREGEGYGYDVINYIQNRTKGHYKIKTFSTIYNTLKRLEEQGYVTSHKGGNETNGAVRVYYTLTEEGRKYLEENKLEYKYLRTLLDNLLTNEDFDLDNDEIPYSASELKPLTKRVRSSADNEASFNYDYGDDKSDNNYSYPDDNDDSYMLTNEAVASEATEINKDFNESVSVPDNKVIKSDNDTAVNNAVKIELIKPQGNQTTEKISRLKQPDNDYKAVFDKITAPVMAGLYKDTQKTTPKPQQRTVKKSSSTASTAKTERKTVVSTLQNPEKEKQKPDTSSVNLELKTEKENINVNNIEKFRNNLRSDGYVLNMYKPDTKNSTRIKYIFINKLMRDAVVLSALYGIITLLVLYLCKDIFEVKLTTLCAIGGVFAAIALVFVFVWARNPDKRKKDSINLKAINALTIALFTVIFMLDLIISLLIPNGKSLNSPQIYAPVIIASSSLVFGIILSVLYKSENYFQK